MEDDGKRITAIGGGDGCSGGGKDSIAIPSSSLSDANYKVKLMCSYGGKIQPRPRGNKLMYVGGDTKILTVDRNIKFSDIVKKLNCLLNGEVVGIKYQLPGEDLDVLISIGNQEDLDNLMHEYDRLHNILPPNQPVRMRLLLSVEKPAKLSSNSGLDVQLNPDYLFGFDKEYDCSNISNTGVIQSETAFDLELWKIPIESRGESVLDTWICNEVQKMAAHDNHITRDVTVRQVVYPVPVVSVGLQLGQYGMQGMVKMGVVNGCREQPIYNLVPSMPSLPEQM